MINSEGKGLYTLDLGIMPHPLASGATAQGVFEASSAPITDIISNAKDACGGILFLGGLANKDGRYGQQMRDAIARQEPYAKYATAGGST